MELLINPAGGIVSILVPYKVSIVRKDRLVAMPEVNLPLLVLNQIQKKDNMKVLGAIYLKNKDRNRTMELQWKVHIQQRKVLVNPTQLYYKIVRR
jgi:hypothetical protein